MCLGFYTDFEVEYLCSLNKASNVYTWLKFSAFSLAWTNSAAAASELALPFISCSYICRYLICRNVMWSVNNQHSASVLNSKRNQKNVFFILTLTSLACSAALFEILYPGVRCAGKLPFPLCCSYSSVYAYCKDKQQCFGFVWLIWLNIRFW